MVNIGSTVFKASDWMRPTGMTRANDIRALDWIARRLKALMHVTVSAPGRGHDFQIRVLEGRGVGFDVVFQRPASEEWVKRYAEDEHRRVSTNPLLATDRLTSAARANLRSAGLSWIEERTGVLYLVAPGLLIDNDPYSLTHVVGRQSVSPYGARPARLRGQSGLCAETLLRHRATDKFHAKDLAAATGLSGALVSRVLARLGREGIVEATGAGPKWRAWTLSNAGALLDRWADEEVGPQTESAIYAHGRTARDLYAKIADLEKSGIPCALGGVAAANLWTPSLATLPWPEYLWIPASLPANQIAEALGGSVVADGANLRLWQTAGDPALYHRRPAAPGQSRSMAVRLSEVPALAPFSVALDEKPSVEIPVVSPARAYVEALQARGRGRDVAKRLREVLFK
jgi:hypothetical protein